MTSPYSVGERRGKAASRHPKSLHAEFVVCLTQSVTGLSPQKNSVKPTTTQVSDHGKIEESTTIDEANAGKRIVNCVSDA